MVVGSDDGKVRLYSEKTLTQAKTAIPGLGLPITNVDVTYDGEEQGGGRVGVCRFGSTPCCGAFRCRLAAFAFALASRCGRYQVQQGSCTLCICLPAKGAPLPSQSTPPHPAALPVLPPHPPPDRIALPRPPPWTQASGCWPPRAAT